MLGPMSMLPLLANGTLSQRRNTSIAMSAVLTLVHVTGIGDGPTGLTQTDKFGQSDHGHGHIRDTPVGAA